MWSGGAQRISQCLFQGDVQGLHKVDVEQLRQDGMDCTVIDAAKVGLIATFRRA